MGMKIRRVLAAVLVLAAAVGLVLMSELGIKAKAADTEATEVVYDYVYDISEYREDGTVEFKADNYAHVVKNTADTVITQVYKGYPTKEGYVFAGWYTDVKSMLPLDQEVTSGEAYAKFVPEKLLTAAAQVSINTDYTTASSTLRFIAAVDNLDYNQIGLTMNKVGGSKAYVHASTKVYESLSAAVAGGQLTIGEEEAVKRFGESAGYFFAVTLTGIKNQGNEYTVKPFWVTYDGTYVEYVETDKKTVEMGVDANVAAKKTEVKEHTEWYKNSQDVLYINTVEEFKAFAELSKTNNFKGKTIKLGADIAFNEGIAGNKLISTDSGAPFFDGVEATLPVGSTEVPFAGTFDGQGHTVSGLAAKSGYVGLFAAIKGATVKNVRVTRSTLRGESSGMSAGLVATTYGVNTIENVYIGADVNLHSASYQGGVVAHNQGQLTVRNAWSNAYSNLHWVTKIHSGGIVGSNANTAGLTLTLENCLFTGSIVGTAQGESYAGGLVGASMPSPVTTLTDCLSAGSITAVLKNGDAEKNAFGGSIIGTKSWTDANTVTTDVYATEECYSQTVRYDQSFASGVEVVAEADLYGALAETNASGLDYGSNWTTVEDSTPVLWVRASDTSWYNETSTEFTLNNISELCGLATLVNAGNTFAGKTVKLGADITLNEGDASGWMTTAPASVWTSIGTSTYPFAGTFDGQGHTVSGLYYKASKSSTYYGMFAYVKDAKIRNLTLTNSCFYNASSVGSCVSGAIIAQASGVELFNVHVTSSVYMEGSTKIGMVGSIAGAYINNIDKCTSALNASGIMYRKYIGGIVSAIESAASTTYITNCLSTCAITVSGNGADCFVGGLVGMNGGDSKVYITNCVSAPAIDATGMASAGYIGSAFGATAYNKNVGTMTNVYATNCYQNADNTFVAIDASRVQGTAYNGSFSLVDEANLYGELAATNAANLDFTYLWRTNEDAVPTPDGGVEGVDVSWYNPVKTEYVLYDAEDLYGFAYLVNKGSTFYGKTIKLGADIVINEGNAVDWATNAPANNWIPMGDPGITPATLFAGTFDGQGHTISGLYQSFSGYYGGGFFGYINNGAKIKDFRLVNSYFNFTGSGNGGNGAVIGYAVNATISNVYTDAIVNATSGYVGGIAGRAQATGSTFENCTFAGKVTSTADGIGGIVGFANSNLTSLTVKNCEVTGTVGGKGYVGGVLGYANGAENCTITITDSTFNGTVKASDTASTTGRGGAGGIVGRHNNRNLVIKNCLSSGLIDATGGYYDGGIVGCVTGASTAILSMDNCHSTATITNAGNAGGLVGRFINAGVPTITNCTSAATITNANWASGVVAGHMQKLAANISNVYYAVNGATKDTDAIGSDANNITNSPIKVSDSELELIRNNCRNGIVPDCNGFLDSLDSTTNTYTISDVEDLYGFMVASWSDDFSGYTVELANDITVNGKATYGDASTWDRVAPKYGWYPIGTDTKMFAGTFDGQGHTISGIYCEYPGGNGMGLFGFVSGTIKNFRLENSYFENTVSSNYGYNASVAGYLSGTVSQVYSSAVMKTVDSWAGGIVGMVAGEAVITECQFDGSLMARCSLEDGCTQEIIGDKMNLFAGNGEVSGRGHAAFVGGIAGCLKGTSVDINNCLYTGKIYNECINAHRTGGIMGGINEGAATITKCISAGNFVTLNRTPDSEAEIELEAKGNSYHFNMIMDCRGLGGMPANAETLFEDNYILSKKLYAATGELVNKGTDEVNGDNIASATGWTVPIYDEDGNPVLDDEGNQKTKTAVRYDEDALGKKLEAYYASHTGNLDFDTIWKFNNSWKTSEDKLPTLRFGDTSQEVPYIYHGAEGEDESLFLVMDNGTLGEFTDKEQKATPITDSEGTQLTTTGGYPLYTLEDVVAAPAPFENIDYSDGGYITKYVDATLENYNSYIQKLVDFGFTKGESNIINTDDAYYTALTFGNNGYSVTYFANSGELYVTASGNMKHSPYMNAEYYKTAVNTEGGEPTTQYDDITVTMLELSNGGLCQIIRLKNGHYIVIDGGTGSAAVGTTVINQDTGEEYTIKAESDCADETEIEYNRKIKASRAELAAALGATVRPVVTKDEETGEEITTYEDPAVIVDAWIFTHDHDDHAGWLSGGVFGAMQVDVYIKGFYYNFSNVFREDAQIKVGEKEDEEGNLVDNYVDGYQAQSYKLYDTVDGVEQYYRLDPSTDAFWVEYSATRKTAANVNTPSWGTRGIPIYRVQAGQKFYFDGVTVEVPYTQDQVQPVEYNYNSGESLALNSSCAWYLFTDDHGNTFLEAGDAELHNQDEVIALYDDYYDGGDGPNYALFGADVVNAFHHGLNLAVEQTLDDEGNVTATDFTRLNTLFGIQNESGIASEANTATTAEDGRTKFLFYTRGYLNTLFGYLSDHTSESSKNQQANHYLTGYVYPKLIDASLESAKAFQNLTSPIPFSSYCTKADEAGVSWQGTTTVTFSSTGVVWDKYESTSIYATDPTESTEESAS